MEINLFDRLLIIITRDVHKYKEEKPTLAQRFLGFVLNSGFKWALVAFAFVIVAVLILGLVGAMCLRRRRKYALGNSPRNNSIPEAQNP